MFYIYIKQREEKILKKKETKENGAEDKKYSAINTHLTFHTFYF